MARKLKLSASMLAHLRFIRDVTGPNSKPIAQFGYRANQITFEALLRRGLVEVEEGTKIVTIKPDGWRVLDEHRGMRDADGREN